VRSIPHHFIPLLLRCLSASLKMVRDITSEQRRRQLLSKPTLWAVASWLIFCPAAAWRPPDGTLGLEYYGLTMTLIFWRESMAAKPSGTPSRSTLISRTGDGSIFSAST